MNHPHRDPEILTAFPIWRSFTAQLVRPDPRYSSVLGMPTEAPRLPFRFFPSSSRPLPAALTQVLISGLCRLLTPHPSTSQTPFMKHASFIYTVVSGSAPTPCSTAPFHCMTSVNPQLFNHPSPYWKFSHPYWSFEIFAMNLYYDDQFLCTYRRPPRNWPML